MQLQLDKIVGGGQALGTLDDGRKAFVWGGLPGEKVTISITKKKSKYIEGIVEEVLEKSSERATPLDSGSYLSTSPWQIMNFQAEQRYKTHLIKEAFDLQGLGLPSDLSVITDDHDYGYRNKLEFSWYSELDEKTGLDSLDLAFFKRGSRGKVIVEGSTLANENINILARNIRDVLRKKKVSARSLKTLLIRADRHGNSAWQLYTKDRLPNLITPTEAAELPAQGGEIIFSNPKSPASVITERLARFGELTLTDHVLSTSFRYAIEGFFQVNIPVYELALKDMAKWVPKAEDAGQVIDLYSGVGTIGLTIGGEDVTLVEINQAAVSEMERNIASLGIAATPVLASSENALEQITSDRLVIVDPPRAGLHRDVVDRLLEVTPSRIIYLSCNPVTQARDVRYLLDKYRISHVQGYNFFPRTPHIENLIVLDKL